MTLENPEENNGSAPELLMVQTPEVGEFSNNETFFDQLYHHIVTWLQTGGGQIHKDFLPQTVENWETVSDFHKGTWSAPIRLMKGCIIKDKNKYFFLALGQGRRNQYSPGNHLRLQYSFSPHSRAEISSPEDYTVEDLKSYINPHPIWEMHNSVGEIYAPPKGNIHIDSWVATFPYGREIFSGGTREFKSSSNGIQEALSVIQDQVRRTYRTDLS